MSQPTGDGRWVAAVAMVFREGKCLRHFLLVTEVTSPEVTSPSGERYNGGMEEQRFSNSWELIPADLDLEDVDDFVAAAGKIDWSRVGGVTGPQSYRLALGGRPIQLGGVPFRILLYLASRPYHAFTRKEISAAAGTAETPLTPETVDEQIACLRDQLGILHDYVQTVPFVGYRFKA